MVNHQYKDATIKLFLTQKEGRLVRLVNSICGTSYPDDTPIADNTLGNVVFNGVYNDLSFCYEGNLHLMLIEHQSTLNNNMPVRILMYLARVYEKILQSENVYVTRGIPLPRPHLVVLYNGIEDCPEVQTLRLSDAFACKKPGEMPDAEIVVHMYNINYNEEHMPVLLRQNSELCEYAEFIQTAREYIKAGMKKEEALRKAVNDFARRKVMGPFLEENASEVVNMLMTEWNTEEYGRIQRNEGREEGREEGRIEGFTESLKRLMFTTKVPFQEAAAMLKLTPEEVEACRDALTAKETSV